MRGLPPKEMARVIEQLQTIQGKMNMRPLDDRNADGTALLRSSVVVSMGELAQGLTRDMVKNLRSCADCATMIVELHEAEEELAIVLDEIRQSRMSFKDKV